MASRLSKEANKPALTMEAAQTSNSRVHPVSNPKTLLSSLKNNRLRVCQTIKTSDISNERESDRRNTFVNVHQLNTLMMIRSK